MSFSLLALRMFWGGDAWVVLPGVLLASLVVLASARVSLSISDTFPELGRFRFLRALLG
jgi:hypothetical protein